MPDGKVAVLYRGPMRPNVASFIEKLQHFSATLDQASIVYDTFVATWSNQADLDRIFAADIPRLSIIAIEQPAESEILRKVDGPTNATQGSKRNIYWQYYLSRIALRTIACTERYDYIVHTRTDIRIDLGDHLTHWFEDGIYSAIHVKSDGFINDQFGIAQTALMEAAWDYGNDANLIRMIDTNDKAEGVLQEMIEARGIVAKRKDLAVWELDALRK